MMTVSSPAGLVAAGMAVVLLAAGCSTAPERESPPAQPQPAVPATEPGPAAVGPLERALEYLQAGRMAAAGALLERILSDHPGHPLAALLYRQLTDDPGAVLGGPFVEIEVGPGDTLSQIAARHAGDPMLFVALARLNGIDRPGLIEVGQRLAVPAGDRDAASGDDSEIEVTAAALLAAGRAQQAYSLLLSVVRSGETTETFDNLLTEAAMRLSERWLVAGDTRRSLDALSGAAGWLNSPATRKALNRQRERIQSRILLARARRALDSEKSGEALMLLRRAREYDADLGRSDEQAAGVIEPLTEHYHALALSAWREQRVNQAIALWEQVVEIDPRFEPAAVYLARAKALRQRLDAMPPPGEGLNHL